MKIKVADLKANLSRYLRQVQESGESIEICVREDRVAYLSPAAAGVPDAGAARASETLRRRLQAAGLTLAAEGSAQPLPRIQPAAAGDGRTDIKTVAALRAGRDW